MASILEVWTDSLLENKTGFLWLVMGDLKGETENEIAAQGQKLSIQISCDRTIKNRNT